MQRPRLKILGLAVCLAGSLSAPRAFAADHLDGAKVLTDPSTDITDLYTWTSADGTKVNLVMNVAPVATTASTFSNAAQYVFHVSSCAAYGAACNTAQANIICTFDTSTPQKVSCWVGVDDYVTGDASGAAGITSYDGKVKVFTGLRDDPFFFNLDGFKATVSAVTAAAPSLAFDVAGCPAINAATSHALVTLLSTSNSGPAQDFFAGFNVLSIVLQVDKSLLTKGGPIVGIWASTNK